MSRTIRRKGGIAFLGILLLVTSAQAQLLSPGFESGPVTPIISFPPTPGPLVWRASHTDGERVQTTLAKPAAEGSYYASLLQNAGAGPAAAQPFGNFGFTGYDRIYDTFSVTPNTTYFVSFQHASDDRFGYLADTTVVTVGAADNSAVFSHLLVPTPGLFNWTPFAFSFTTNSATTLAAIGFTTRGDIHSSVVIDAVHIFIPEPASGAVLAIPLMVLSGRRRR